MPENNRTVPLSDDPAYNHEPSGLGVIVDHWALLKLWGDDILKATIEDMEWLITRVKIQEKELDELRHQLYQLRRLHD